MKWTGRHDWQSMTVKQPTPERVILRHPTQKLEVVVPHGTLAQLLINLGYRVVEPEPLDHTPLSTDLEGTNDNEDDQ